MTIRLKTYRDSASLVIVLVCVGLGACQDETRTDGGISVQIEDSAGVRIVEYIGTPDVNAPFQFPAEPRYRHGTNAGDYAFQGIDPGTILPDGSTVLSDVFNDELVMLSPDGTSHEVLARHGEDRAMSVTWGPCSHWDRTGFWRPIATWAASLSFLAVRSSTRWIFGAPAASVF